MKQNLNISSTSITKAPICVHKTRRQLRMGWLEFTQLSLNTSQWHAKWPWDSRGFQILGNFEGLGQQASQLGLQLNSGNANHMENTYKIDFHIWKSHLLSLCNLCILSCPTFWYKYFFNLFCPSVTYFQRKGTSIPMSLIHRFIKVFLAWDYWHFLKQHLMGRLLLRTLWLKISP